MRRRLWVAGVGLGVLGASVVRAWAQPADAAAARRRAPPLSAPMTPDVQRAMPKPKGLPVTLVRDRIEHIVLAKSGQLFADDVEAIARFFV